MQQAGRGAFVCILIAAMVASSGIARAATIIVNDASDALHATGCAATGTGTCTLRDAITFSNQNAGRDTIVPVGGLGLIAPAVPLPPLVDAVELRGTPPSASPASAWGLRLVGSGAAAGAQGVLNVTVAESTGSGFVNFGVGKCPAPLTSTINFAQGQTRANSALLNLDASGNATVTPLVTGSGTVHLILDVNGYFE